MTLASVSLFVLTTTSTAGEWSQVVKIAFSGSPCRDSTIQSIPWIV